MNMQRKNAGGNDPIADHFKDQPGIEGLLAKHAEATERAVKGVSDQVTELKAEMTELHQRGSRRGGEGGDAGETWGAQFIKAEGLKEFVASPASRKQFAVEVKAITSAAASGGALTAPVRDVTNPMPTRRLFLRDLIPTIPVSSTPVEYPRQTVRTNAAAPVEEGTLKPESGYQWQLTDVPIRTIAHWVQASRQILSDAPQLSGLIDTELLYGLMLAEEAQFLTGSGVDQNIHGIIPQATAYAAPFAVTDETMIDRIGLAILQQDLTDLPADGVALHPSDWMRMRLIKNADGEYILGDPGADVEPRIFGRPVVATQAMTVDKFLTGSFQLAATIYDREQSRIEASTEDRDNFVKNLVTVLAEERVGLAVKRTPGFTYGDFGNVA